MRQKAVVVVPRSPSNSGTRACWKCGTETALTHRCAHCQTLQDLPLDLDHFAVLGLPRTLNLDDQSLRERFYELSRQTHPDRFGSADPRQAGYALKWSTAVNRAYQTLRDPASRSYYLLELENGPAPSSSQVPLELAELYFDLQDSLSEDTGLEKMRGFQKTLNEQQAALPEEWQAIAQRWDTGENKKELASALRQHLVKRRYLQSMSADLERKLAQRT